MFDGPMWCDKLDAMRTSACLFTLFCGVAGRLPAQGSEAPGERPVWMLSVENDKFFAGTDRHYTQGLRLTYYSPRPSNAAFEQRLGEFLSTFRLPLAEAKIARSIGQDLFTPADTDEPSLIAEDRPYAAWLYYSVGYHAITKETPEAPAQSFVVEASVGAVGPSAQGEFAQNRWHDLIGVPRAQGWKNQLRDEPGVMLTVERRLRLPVNRHMDILPRSGLVLGNVRTHASVGGAVRLGWDLPKDFGADLIRPAAGDVGMTRKGFGFYGFVAADTRLVLRNIFLDGNTWKDSHSVRKKRVSWDVNAGISLNWPRLRIVYTQNYRAKEFYGQLRRDVFGSVSLIYLH